MQACASNPVSRCFKCKQLVQQIRCSFDQVPEPVHFVLPAGKSACYASLRLHKAAQGCQTHQTLACPIEINAAGGEENGEWLGQTTQAQQDMMSRSMKKPPSLWMLELMHLVTDSWSGLGLWRNFLKSLASVLAHDRIQLLLMRPLRIPDLLSCQDGPDNQGQLRFAKFWVRDFWNVIAHSHTAWNRWPRAI